MMHDMVLKRKWIFFEAFENSSPHWLYLCVRVHVLLTHLGMPCGPRDAAARTAARIS